MDRVASIGEAPAMSRIENPVMQEAYQPVSLPMPTPDVSARQANSLWHGSRQTFFEDQLANEIGDIITVVINIDDGAELENETSRSRQSAENAGLDNLLGYEASLGRLLPEAIDNTNLIGADADSSHRGEGSIEREEEIELELAALITQILPNGNMVIFGRQEVRVNYEKRILSIDGVIRPEDISTNNTISAEKIAEARIVYGGEGQISDVQQPRYGQQLYDIVFPF
jgi:flagellar L-ring protein precursor FlgH